MQQRLFVRLSVYLLFCGWLAPAVMASQLVEGKLESKLLPQPVEYNVLLPDGYDAAKEPLPLLLFLHGGGGDRNFLTRSRSIFDELWKAGTLPPMVVVTPSAGRSFYMDYKDGSQRWETFVVTDFLNHLREKFKVTKARQGTLVMGISMGGMGALRFGFKYPEKFAALAALEPGIDPALKWKDVKPRNRFYRGQDLMEMIFGKPFDEAWWEANNPASIVSAKADKLRAANLGIYLEVGDEDSLNLHEAAEFLHRVLWDQQLKHEYHLVRGADHVGRTMRGRIMEGLEFLSRTLNPPPPDPEVENLKQRIAPLKKQWGVPER
ncbi:MAG: alpha/beta hydrolase [Acidobacteria bacterium]|nr:alpha/beta hydrolase [Acidobacteriota bacterium]MBI3425438.1 alpha/beta hydrolase [Acidobacteriota bacterium]